MGGEERGGRPLSDEIDGLVSGDGELSDTSFLRIPVPNFRAVIGPASWSAIEE